MSDPIAVGDQIRIPAHAITMRAARASGPGGQNVNRVATKVILEIDLGAVEGLSADQRARLAQIAGRRIDADGRLVVSSQEARTQARNLETAREKARALVASALPPPRRRRPTRPGLGAKERRIAEKKRHGEIKRLRGDRRDD